MSMKTKKGRDERPLDANVSGNCPQCKGIGYIFGLLPPIALKCDFCKGEGLVSDQQLLQRMQGGKIKEWRIKQEMTLRQAARKYNIDASNLSKMERGVIKPRAYYR